MTTIDSASAVGTAEQVLRGSRAQCHAREAVEGSDVVGNDNAVASDGGRGDHEVASTARATGLPHVGQEPRVCAGDREVVDLNRDSAKQILDEALPTRTRTGIAK